MHCQIEYKDGTINANAELEGAKDLDEAAQMLGAQRGVILTRPDRPRVWVASDLIACVVEAEG